MRTPHSIHRALFLVLLLTVAASGLAQQPNQHWVATWAASPQQPAAVGGQRGPAPAAPTAPANPNAAPPAAPAGGQRGTPPLASLNNQTVRMFVRTSVGGTGVRVEFSNAYGTAPLTIGSAHL